MKDPIERQAAIDSLDKRFDSIPMNQTTEILLLRKDLRELPSAQPEHLTDDDFETIRIHLSAFKESLCNQRRWKEAEDYERLISRFMSFASAQPERKRGKWIDYANSHCECSVCHTEWSYFQNETECFEFCPNCGADMREVDDERPD